MVKYKKNLQNGIGLMDKLSAVKETCGQSLWVLVVVGVFVVVSSLLGFFLEARTMFIVNLVLGGIGIFVGTRGIKRVRKVVLKQKKVKVSKEGGLK